MALLPVAGEQPTSQPAHASLTIIGLYIFVFLLKLILGDSPINTLAFAPAHLTAFLHGNDSFQAALAMTVDRQPHY